MLSCAKCRRILQNFSTFASGVTSNSANLGTKQCGETRSESKREPVSNERSDKRELGAGCVSIYILRISFNLIDISSDLSKIIK